MKAERQEAHTGLGCDAGRDKAIEVLREVHEVLNHYGVVYWLDQGTLLGAARDGDLIPWDSDIDLGMWADDEVHSSPVWKTFEQRGYYVSFNRRVDLVKLVKRSWKIGSKKIDISLYRLSEGKAQRRWSAPRRNLVSGVVRSVLGPVVDVFERKAAGVQSFYEVFEGKKTNARDEGSPLWRLARKRLEPLREVLSSLEMSILDLLPGCVLKVLAKACLPVLLALGYKPIEAEVCAKYYQELSDIELYGMIFSAPRQLVEYLELKFGEDWRVPKREWTFYREDGAVQL